jgi:predicted transglutaminase-like cysteine proteinase
MAVSSALIVRLARKAALATGMAGAWGLGLHDPVMAADIAGLARSADHCSYADNFAPAAAGQEIGVAAMSKSDAILGGTESALDRIRNQQTGLALPAAATIWRASDSLMAAPSACASSDLVMQSIVQTQPSLTAINPVAQPAQPIILADNQDTFLATQRVEINRTAFSGNWQRVAEAHISGDEALHLIGASAAENENRLQAVNRWVNRNISYAEDRVLWSRRDYWATASETIALGKGDCEDLAILKYQILVALGVDPNNLYLTLARDLVRNADHAVLVVRQGGTYYLLDNASDAILPANVAYDYRPTLSFNSQSAWLHGAVTRAPQLASATYLSVSAISRPRVIGLNR